MTRASCASRRASSVAPPGAAWRGFADDHSPPRARPVNRPSRPVHHGAAPAAERRGLDGRVQGGDGQGRPGRGAPAAIRGGGRGRVSSDVRRGGVLSRARSRVVLLEGVDRLRRARRGLALSRPAVAQPVRLLDLPRQLTANGKRQTRSMNFNPSEWLNLLIRWVHVFAAILLLGSTYYFTWLDGQMRRLEERTDGKGGAVWMVHSGGFYTVVKQKALAVPPGEVHWFRYEALTTFISGFLLLNLVYYHGGVVVGPVAPKVTSLQARLIGIGVLVVGRIVYDALVRTPLVKNEPAFAAVAFVLVILTTIALSRLISTRATDIPLRALFGTLVVLNVWMRILPPQRRMIAA